MKLKRVTKKAIALTLSAALVLTGASISSRSASAAKKATLKLNKKKATVTVGKKVTLKVTKKNVKKIKKITWKTNKKAVATVSKKGVVTGKKAGTAKITATVKYTVKGSKKVKKKALKCTVTVTDKNKTTYTSAPADKTDTPSASDTPGGTTTEPPAGTTTQPPAGATTQPPAGGTTTEPPAGTTTEPPAGTTTEPPAGTTTEPPAGTTTQPPAGATTEPPASTTTQPPASATTQPPTETEPAAKAKTSYNLLPSLSEVDQRGNTSISASDLKTTTGNIESIEGYALVIRGKYVNDASDYLCTAEIGTADTGHSYKITTGNAYDKKDWIFEKEPLVYILSEDDSGKLLSDGLWINITVNTDDHPDASMELTSVYLAKVVDIYTNNDGKNGKFTVCTAEELKAALGEDVTSLKDFTVKISMKPSKDIESVKDGYQIILKSSTTGMNLSATANEWGQEWINKGVDSYMGIVNPKAETAPLTEGLSAECPETEGLGITKIQFIFPLADAE